MSADEPSPSRSVERMLDKRRQDSERVDKALHEAFQAHLRKTGALPAIAALAKQAGVGRSTIYRKLEKGDTSFAKFYKKLNDAGASRRNAPASSKAGDSNIVQIAILRKKIDALEAALRIKNQEISTLKRQLTVCRGQLRQQIASPIPPSK